jgi:hypothetical protein
MSASPVFFITPRINGVNTSASNNDTKTLAGTNNTVAVIAGVATGTIIERVIVVQNDAAASVADNIIRFYIFDGTSYFLVHELALGGSVTPSATVIGKRFAVPEIVGMKLPTASYVLHVGLSNAATDSFTVTAQVVDL